VEFADHRVGRVEHVAEVVFDSLAQEQARTCRIQSVIFLQPAEHFSRCVLQRLVERSSIADGKDIFGIFASRPTNAFAFDYPNRFPIWLDDRPRHRLLAID